MLSGKSYERFEFHKKCLKLKYQKKGLQFYLQFNLIIDQFALILKTES